MSIRDDNGKFIVEHDVRVDARLDKIRLVTKSHVDALFVEHLQKCFHRVAHDINLDSRILLHEHKHGFFEERQKRISRADVQFARIEHLNVANAVETTCGRFQSSHSLRKKSLSDISKTYMMRVARKERCSEFVFKLLNLL